MSKVSRLSGMGIIGSEQDSRTRQLMRPSGWRAIGEARVLSAGELELAREEHVGLYDGEKRCTEYDKGTLIVTTLRILWVRGAWRQGIRSEESGQLLPGDAVYVDLKDILRTERHSGFLTASPKILLYLCNTEKAVKEMSWICSVCDGISSREDSCPHCGVEGALVACDASAQNRSWYCEVCETINSCTDKKCQLCGVSNNSPCEATSTVVSNDSNNLPVKISFRASGIDTVYSRLQKALERAEPVPFIASANQKGPVLGIGSIMRDMDMLQIQKTGRVQDSFRDIDSLMRSATEMIDMTKRIYDQLIEHTGHLGDSLSKEATDMVQSFFQRLGLLSNPVTRGLLGTSAEADDYHIALAQELNALLLKLLAIGDRSASLSILVSMPDVYCYWNRVRGFGCMLSPQDLVNSAERLSDIGSPFRMLSMPGGSVVLANTKALEERTKAIANSLSWVDGKGWSWTTALALASQENLPTVLAREQLLFAEQEGLLCRDSAPSDTRYYSNYILSCDVLEDSVHVRKAVET